MVVSTATASEAIPACTLRLAGSEVRFAAVPPASEPVLSADLFYTEYWNDDVASGRADDMDIDYRYNDSDPVLDWPQVALNPTMPRPTNNFCQPVWLYNCRVTINYEAHIHAIFQLDRDVNGVDDFTPLEPVNPTNTDPTNTALQVVVWLSEAWARKTQWEQTKTLKTVRRFKLFPINGQHDLF